MKKIRCIGFGILVLFFLVGCYGTVGKNFDSSQVKNIQNNVTSQSEILEKFGTSFKEGTENGQTMWTYQFDQWNALDPAQSKDLVILFDKKNTITMDDCPTIKKCINNLTYIVYIFFC